MKIFKTTTLFLTLLFSASVIQAQGIAFKESSWEELVQKASEENKYIFVDGYASWCGPCKKMAKEVFPDERVGNWYNNNFVSLKLDMEEQGFGTEFAKKHSIDAYPTFMFFTPTGEFAHRVAGYRSIDEFVEVGLNAMDPEKNLAGMMKTYQSGSKDPEFLYAYVAALSNAALETNEAVVSYLKTQSEKQLLDEKNWQLISRNLYDASSPYFKKVLTHEKQLIDLYGEEVHRYIGYVYDYEIDDVVESKNKKRLEDFKATVQKEVPHLHHGINAKADYIFYKSDADKAHPYAVKYYDRYCNDWNELNAIAWHYFEKVDDPAKLEKALFWVNRSIQMEEHWYNTDTQANLLYKLNRLEEAQRSAQNSIDVAKANGDDPKETQELLGKIITELENGQSR